MKPSDKFWTFIFATVIILLTIFVSKWFLLWIPYFLAFCYIYYCFLTFFSVDEDSWNLDYKDNEAKYNILYWIVQVPIMHFNNFLNNKL